MTPDQEELLIKAQQSLDAARLLLEGGFFGFAASRAYYTQFSQINKATAQKHIDHAAQFIVEAAKLIGDFSQHPHSDN